MTPRIRLSMAAQRDVAAAQAWYAEQEASNLDIRFQLELEQVFKQIERFPEGFPVVHAGIRRANLQRFPYAVFYERRQSVLYVLAVTHHARHPRTWQRRR